MLKDIMVEPKSIVYKPLLIYLIWMKIGTATSRAQTILEKITATHTCSQEIAVTISCHLDKYNNLYKNILSIVKSVKQQTYYFSYIPYNTSIL